MADVLIVGDSHTAALRRGQIAIEADGRWPMDTRLTVRPLGGGHLACDPFFVDRGDHAEITLPEFRRQFDRLPRPDDAPDTVYGISALLHPVRVWRQPAWRHFMPADLAGSEAQAERAAPPGATPVSSGLVRRLALEDQRYMLAFVAILKRLGRRVFAIEAPRPFRHHPALQKTPADVVMRVDRHYREAIGDELRRLGVAVVAVPTRCLDDHGFTRTELGQAGDPHHGNEAYGAIMMDEVLSYLRQDDVKQPATVPAGDRER